MRVVFVIGGALLGAVLGAVLGFCAALAAMSAGPPRSDGSYGMREMLVCLPAGVVLGLGAGIWWGITTSLASG